MKRGFQCVIWLAAGMIGCGQARAELGAGQFNPYATITKQNIFRLRSPTPTEQPEIQVPRPKIILLGILAGPGPKQLLFKVLAVNSSRADSYVLSENETAGEIEVVEIIERNGSVRLRNHGQEQFLTLEHDGMKPGDAFPGVASRPEIIGKVHSGSKVPPSSAHPPISPELQMIGIEVNRKLTAREVEQGQLPPLPPTPLEGR